MAFKPFLRTAAIIVLPLLLALCAATAWLLTSESAAQFVLPRIAGTSVKLQGIHGSLAGPLHIERVRIEQESQRLEIDALQLAWRPLALLHGELHILSLQAARLGVIQKIDAKSEPMVLPATLMLPLTLQVDRLHVDGGDIGWGAVNLIHLGGLDLQLAYDGRQYRMQLKQFAASGAQAGASASTILSGQLTLGAQQPYALQAQFASSGKTVLEQQTLETTGQLKLAGSLQSFAADLQFALGAAQLNGKAVLQPFTAQPLHDADLRAEALDLSALNPDWPHTALSGSLRSAGKGRSELTLLNRLAGPLDQQRVPVHALQLALSQKADQLTIDKLNVALGQEESQAGKIQGQGLYAKGALTLALKVDGLDLRGLDKRLRATALAGQIDLRHDHGQQDLTLSLHEAIGKKDAALDAHVQLSDTRLAIDSATLRYAGARMSAKGHVQLDGTQSFAAEGELQGLDAKELGHFSTLPQLVLNGRFKLQGERVPALVADLDFHLDDSRLAGRPLRGDGQALLRADRIRVPNLLLAAGENQLVMSGELAEGASALDFSLSAPKLEQLGSGFGGAFSLSGTVNGSFQQPHLRARWDGSRISAPAALYIASTQGRGELTLDQRQPELLSAIRLEANMVDLRSAQQRLEKLQAHLQFSPQANAPLALELHAEGLTTPQLRIDSLVAKASGSTARHSVQMTLQEAGQTQQWTTQLNGGLLSHEQTREQQPYWQGEISRFDAHGRFNAQLAAPASLGVGAQRLQLDGFNLDAQGGRLQITRFLREGRVISSTGRLQQLELAQLLAWGGLNPALSTDLRLEGEWDVKMADQLSGQIALRRIGGDVILRSGTPLALGLNTLDASASMQAGGIALRLNAQGQRLGRIAVNATADAHSRATLNESTMVSGNASIDIPSLAWLGPLLSPGTISEGRLKSDITLAGTFANPQFAGRINGEGLRLFLSDSGIDLRQGVLDSEFRGESLYINNLAFRSEAGQIAAKGEIGLAAAKPTATITLRAERYALYTRSDRKLVLSGQADLDWAAAHGRVNGSVRADSGYFDIGAKDMPQLSDDVVVIGSNPKTAAPMATEINMKLDLGEGVKVEGKGLSATLVGELNFHSAPGSSLRAQGSVRVADGTDSTYSAYSRKLAIEQGVLRFNGPLSNPALDILAMRRGEEVEAGVAVRGTVLAPRVTLVSEPTVPDAERLAWLVLGHGLDNAGNADMGALQSAAGALLTGGAAAGVQKQLATAFGFDDFKIGSTTQDNLQQRIVTLGKRVSSRLYLSYQQSLQSTGSVLLLRYTLSPRLTIEAEAGTRSALSLLYNVAFD